MSYYEKPTSLSEIEYNLNELRKSNDLWRLPQDTVLDMIQDWVMEYRKASEHNSYNPKPETSADGGASLNIARSSSGTHSTEAGDSDNPDYNSHYPKPETTGNPGKRMAEAYNTDYKQGGKK